MERILVSGPSITEKEIAYVTEAVSTAWFANANVFHQRFEAAFARHVGLKTAITLPSCTSAIHLALLAAGVAAGDEVIVPDATWIATSAPIHYVGATPVFADIDSTTWCIDVASVESLITSKTRAVIAVDLYGGMPEYEALQNLCRERKLLLIEDAAESIGSRYHDRPAGSLGDIGVFSFHGSKTLTTGEGGMIVSERDDLTERIHVLRDHGRARGDRMFFNQEIGQKYKMSSMQAALGLAQLERIDELIAGKRRIFNWYRERLADIPGVALNAEPPGTRNSYWMVTVVFDPSLGLGKNEVMERLDQRGIDSRPFFHPLSSIPAYADHPSAAGAKARNRVSYRISPYGVNLPSGLQLREVDADRVCSALKEIIGH